MFEDFEYTGEQQKTPDTFLEMYRTSMKVFMGLVCLLALSFMLERLVFFIVPQLFVMGVPAALFFALLLAAVSYANFLHKSDIQERMQRDLQRWWGAHKTEFLLALTADLLGLLLGVLPALSAALLLFGANAIPHLVCIAIAVNILLATPRARRNRPESDFL